MPVTIDQVRYFLDPDEPDYRGGTALGEEALPHLLALVQGKDPLLAAKAAYLAGLIDGPLTGDVLLEAASSAVPQVRVAAAAALGRMRRTPADEIIKKLRLQPDPGVAKMLRRL